MSPVGRSQTRRSPLPVRLSSKYASDKPSSVKNIGCITDEEASEIDERYRKRLASMLAVDEMVAALVEELEAADELAEAWSYFFKRL